MSLATIRGKIPALEFVTKEISELEKTHVALDQKKSEKEGKFDKEILVEGVSFRYPEANIDSIVNFNLSIKPGQKIGFIGNSGTGKSTFVNLLLGLLKPTKGKILVDDMNISKNLRNWQKQIGYVSQDIYLLDDTIKNNIAFGQLGTNINLDYVSKAIKIAQLESFINSLPHGQETIIGNRGVRLSGGQRQRIGIARALYKRPNILIFDEATSSVDNETEYLIQKAFCG